MREGALHGRRASLNARSPPTWVGNSWGRVRSFEAAVGGGFVGGQQWLEIWAFLLLTPLPVGRKSLVVARVRVRLRLGVDGCGG